MWLSWFGLSLWILSMMWDHVVTDCSTKLIKDGGSGMTKTAYNMPYGCTNDCPPVDPEVHVIAQVGSSRPSGEVIITPINSCSSPVSVHLVLISQKPIRWLLRSPAYEDPNYGWEYSRDQEYGHQKDINVNILDVYVYQTERFAGRSIVGTDEVFEGARIHDAIVMENPSLIHNRQLMTKWAIKKYVVKSINMANRPSEWDVAIGDGCCQSDANTDSQDGSTQSESIGPLIGVAVMVVILISTVLTITCWCYHRKKKKVPTASNSPVQRLDDRGLSSLNRGPASDTIPNLYLSAPEVQPSAPPLPIT